MPRRKRRTSRTPSRPVEAAPARSRALGRRASRAIFVGGAVLLGVVLFVVFFPGLDGFERSGGLAAAALVTGEELPIIPNLERKLDPLISEKYRARDAAVDGWTTEVLNEDVEAQLKKFGKLIAHRETIDPPHVAELVAAECVVDELRPAALDVVFKDDLLTVSRGGPSGTLLQGVAGVTEAVKHLAEPFAGGAEVYVKFKVISVEAVGAAAKTTAYYLAAGPAKQGLLQQNATWHCHWVTPQGQDHPLLTRIEVESYEEVRGRPDARPQFADCTEAVLGGNKSFRQQILPHYEHWLAQIDNALDLSMLGHNGLAIADVNNDGLDDLFVCQPGGLPNRLFIQNADGTATDVSRDAGVDYLDETRSALFVDLDNDGDQDLAIATPRGVYLMSNNGAGIFASAGQVGVNFPYSLSAADFDNDGDLDLYVCSYQVPNEGAPLPYHDANNGSPNMLVRNDGNWRFTDVTGPTGMDVNNRRFSFAASWEDYDNDGDLDLYVANDFGRNNLYRNDGGHFTDVAADAGVEDISAGMGVTWADYNHDGLMDLYVSNMFSAAGNRITYQRRFKPTADAATRSHFQRHARGNSLFENAGDGTFRDVSVEAAVTMGRWAWGCRFVDLNNDGLEDIMVANGMVTNDDTKDL